MSAAGERARQGASAERTERLRRAVSGVRVRGRSVPVERWLMVGGAGMVVIGIPMILLAWFGAARTPYVFEQIPYLLSGGILGLALAVVGALFYFAYWMTRQVQETRRQSEQTESALGRIEELLAKIQQQGAASVAAAPPSAGGRRGAAAKSANGALVATAKGTMVHRASCVVVAGRGDLRPVRPDAPGFDLCKICDPLGDA